MPIFPFKCIECGHTKEELLDVDARDEDRFCPHCSSPMRRAMELQTVHMRPDIEAGYDQSLGTYVGSRRELREKLAYNNAYCPDLMYGSEPQAGRLTTEERDIHQSQDIRVKKTIFERRKEPGWDQPDSVISSTRDDAGQDVVEVEGTADYSKFIQDVKERSTK